MNSRISFPVETILATCHKYGELLTPIPSLEGWAIMAAIASNESSLGRNCTPRHEPAYDLGGAYVNDQQRSLLAQYGSPEAACSYGPWQMMFINCPGYTPSELETDLDGCARCFVAHFNNYVVKDKNAKTLAEIGEVWNGGHVMIGAIPPGVARYVQDLQEAYDKLVGPKVAQ